MTDTTYKPSTVERVITAACGESYGDGMTVTDICHEYAEPGYSVGAAGCVVFGDWNPRRFPRDEEPALTREENLGPRLASALEWIGADVEWHDEWTRCGECYRAFRTSPDSYMWTMYGAYVEDAADYICADCLREDMTPDALRDYVNSPRNAITWANSGDMTAAGWVQWERDEPRQYESGWHPGQDDDPRTVLAEIHAASPDADVVFLIDDVGQFDSRWSAWVYDDDDES